jgi:hypothetical protein
VTTLTLKENETLASVRYRPTSLTHEGRKGRLVSYLVIKFQQNDDLSQKGSQLGTKG